MFPLYSLTSSGVHVHFQLESVFTALKIKHLLY